MDRWCIGCQGPRNRGKICLHQWRRRVRKVKNLSSALSFWDDGIGSPSQMPIRFRYIGLPSTQVKTLSTCKVKFMINSTLFPFWSKKNICVPFEIASRGTSHLDLYGWITIIFGTSQETWSWVISKILKQNLTEILLCSVRMTSVKVPRLEWG
jgi:hypothetical protein